MPPEQYESDDAPERPRKSHLFRNVLILVVILAILGGLIYIYVKVKHPEWLLPEVPAGAGNQTITGEKTNQQVVEESYKLIGWVVLVGVLLLIGYIIYNSMRGKKKGLGKEIITPDVAERLWKQHFLLYTGIESKWEKESKSFVPINPKAIQIHDKLPFYHTATGDSFWLVECEVTEGREQGVHTVVIPLDRGQETVKTGYYRLDTHTPKFQFNLLRNTFPMSSIVDKQERTQMALMEKFGDELGEQLANPEALKQMTQSMSPQSPYGNAIATPMDSYGGYGEGGYAQQPYRRPAPYRRRPTYGRRYYR